jgi:diketogulonate reductase-like aldo/keto reductase
MDTKKLKCGFAMPVLGMGTWGMGGYMKPDPANDDANDIAVLKQGLDSGFNHIDTAEIYADGHAEELVAKSLIGHKRSNIFITSKVYENHLTYDGVRQAVEGSLKRLGTTYLDLYLIHHVVESAPLQETIRGLDRLVEEGLVKNIGVSNFGTDRLKRAQAYSCHKIVANQVHYNLVIREPEPELLPYCQENDVMLIAYRPIQGGSLLENPGELVGRLAKKYRKTPVQIALNWLISQRNVTTIVAMRQSRQIPENLAALDFTLDKEDLELLRRDFPGQQSISDMIKLS